MKRILVIDGNKARRQLLREALCRYGYAVIEATTDLREALCFAQKLKPHIICLEVAHQIMDGYQILTLLKTDPLTQAIPIIGVMSRNKRESHDLIKQAGFDDCIYYPLDPRQHPLELQRFSESVGRK